MRILVVEDDFVSRKLLEKILSDFGKCETAVNGREAIEAYESAIENQTQYDLICLDIMMPELDGREVLKLIRTYEKENSLIKHTHIIMTSALEDERLLDKVRAECDAIIPKPINRNIISNKVKELFATKCTIST